MKVIYFWTGAWYGGVEKLIINLFDYRSFSPDIEPIFVLCHKGMLSDALEKRGATVEIVSELQPNKPFAMVLLWFQLWKVIRKHHPSVWVSHEIDCHLAAWFVERITSVKSVMWIHSSGFLLRKPIYKKLVSRKPDRTICASNHVQKEVNELWPDLKTDCLYYPYAKPQFYTEGGILGRKEVTLLYIGRMVAYKGLADIIEALGKIRHLPFHFIAVGDSQKEVEKDYLNANKKRAETLGIADKVESVGYKAPEQVFDYLLSADVFVHPNKLPEPFGLVFIEALFARCPIVATNIGGAKEILGLQPLKMGDLVPPNDVDALADVLRKYIKDEAYRLQIAQNIKEGFVNICDPSVSMQKLSRILHTIKNKQN